MRVIDTRIINARWYKYSDPAGWCEWGQICGPCLNEQWRSMGRSWDEAINDASDFSHAEWKKKALHEDDPFAPWALGHLFFRTYSW